MSRRKFSRKALLFVLLANFPLLGGCGLGWLYMKVADAQRIKGIKLLTYDTSRDRFGNAQKLFKKAIDNYRESILYDEDGNPSVYHKLGFALLMGDKPDLDAADTEFRHGLRIKKPGEAKPGEEPKAAPASDSGDKSTPKWSERTSVGSGENKQSMDEGAPKPAGDNKPKQSTEGMSEEEVQLDSALELAERIDEKRKDEDYSLYNCGVGLVRFMRAVRDKKDDDFRIASKYFRLADKYSRHPTLRRHGGGLVEKLTALVDLDEVSTPIPAAVMLARVYDYQAEQLLDFGQEKLAENALGSSMDALDSVKLFYESEPRFQLEMANYHFLRKEYSKCLSCLQDIKGVGAFDEIKIANTLKAKALILTAKYDDAMQVISDLIERDPNEPAGLLLRASVNATKKDLKAEADVNTDIELIFANEANTKNAAAYLQAGDIYMSMAHADGAFVKAKSYYIKAFYIEPGNVKANYLLGKCYQALNDTTNMKDCFTRVCKIDPTSSYCHDVDPLIR